MKVLIVDDHPLVRKGITSTLSFEKDIEEVLEASNNEEAIRQINTEEPELAIIDLYLGSEYGLEIVSACKKKGFKTKFIILTSSLKREDYLKSKEVGVDGYILKEAFVEDIIYALNLVRRGKQFIDPEIIKYEIASQSDNNYREKLTPRELDVFVELGKGLSNCEIAQKLYISENTVKKHVSNILSKLGLEHRTQAAILANSLSNY
ncbi:MAG: response regulator transcription factor [Tissierellia bacterium]|nr:response regulator transcription factor [Tissierellia bacterium]